MPTPRRTPASPRPDPLWDHLRELWPDLLILTSIAAVVWFFDATLGHFGAGVVVGLLAGRGPVLFAEVLVDATTGADPQNEHDESVLLDFVHHPVTPPRPEGRGFGGAAHATVLSTRPALAGATRFTEPPTPEA